jgi:sugar/nucleoside kinase (ribokinase family)
VPSIAVAGHLCLDVSPSLSPHARVQPGALIEVGPLSVTLGGSVANTGRALVGLGADVVPYASVGDDELGSLLLAKLAAEGFTDPRLSVSPDLSTSYSLVLEQSGIDRTFWHHTGANSHFDGSEVTTDNHSLLHVGYPPLLPGLLHNTAHNLQQLFSRARQAGVTTSVDLAVVDPHSDVGALDWDSMLSSIFAHTDIATPSLDDLTSALRIDEPYSPGLVDRLADRMLADGVAVVVISAGQHGLHLRTAPAKRLAAGGHVLAPLAHSWADCALTVPPLTVDNPVTTTGTGDASTAGLLVGVTRGATPQQAAALAVACSAAVMRGQRITPDNVIQLDSGLTSVFSPHV